MTYAVKRTPRSNTWSIFDAAGAVVDGPYWTRGIAELACADWNAGTRRTGG